MPRQANDAKARERAQNQDKFLTDDLVAFYKANGGPKWSAKRRGKEDNETVARMHGIASATEIIARKRMAIRETGSAAKTGDVFANIS